MLAWLSLFLAGISEIIWVMTMKASDGFSKPIPTIASMIAAGFSIALLAYSLKSLSVSVAYPIWVAIGIVGVSAIGMLWLKEPANWGKAASIALILIGSIGLKALSK